MKAATDPYHGLSRERYQELELRVSKGLTLIRIHFKTSAWILEACSHTFSLHCLRSRALTLGERSFFADFYRYVHVRGDSAKSYISKAARFGFEIEKHASKRSLQLAALGKIWQKRAFDMAEAIRSM